MLMGDPVGVGVGGQDSRRRGHLRHFSDAMVLKPSSHQRHLEGLVKTRSDGRLSEFLIHWVWKFLSDKFLSDPFLSDAETASPAL